MSDVFLPVLTPKAVLHYELRTMALPLYHKYGFVIYGTRPHGLKYPDGSYDNDYLMIKML